MGDGGIEDFGIGVVFEDFIADGLDEVGFAETRATIEEKWVITVARGINNTFGGRNGEVIIGTDDKVV